MTYSKRQAIGDTVAAVLLIFVLMAMDLWDWLRGDTTQYEG